MSAPFHFITQAGKQLTKFLENANRERPDPAPLKKEPPGLMTKFLHAVTPAPATPQKRTYAVLRELSKLHGMNMGGELPDYDYCERLIKKGLGNDDPESLHRVGEYLAVHDQTDLLKLVFKNSGFPCDFNGSASGDTLLHIAAYRGNAELARFLIEQGADASIKDRHGYTALEQAGIRQYTSAAHRQIADMLGGYKPGGEKPASVAESKDKSSREEIEETARQMTDVPDDIVAPKTARFTKRAPKQP